MSKHPQLKIVPGGRHRAYQVNNIQLIPATESDAPFSTTIKVVEDDRWLVLSAEPVIPEAEEHIIRVMTSLVVQEAQQLGDVLIRSHTWLAIVHDLDQEPICQSVWIEQAMHRILELADERSLSVLSLPLFGIQYAHLGIDQSLDAILKPIEKYSQHNPLQIWLRTPQEHLRAVQDQLEKYTA